MSTVTVSNTTQSVEVKSSGTQGPLGIDWQGDWASGTAYAVRQGVQHDGSSYRCIVAHTAAGATEPGTGADWATYWAVVAQGGRDGIAFNFDSQTAQADPGAGDMRLDNADLSAVTAAVVDATSAAAGNPDVSDRIAAWGSGTSAVKGTLTIAKRSAPDTAWAVYDVTAVTDNTGYLSLALTYVDHAGSFADGDGLWLSFVPHGNEAYVYIAYASDDQGTDFTTTFDASLDYIAVLKSATAIQAPEAEDFAGLWKKYKGVTGDAYESYGVSIYKSDGIAAGGYYADRRANAASTQDTLYAEIVDGDVGSEVDLYLEVGGSIAYGPFTVTMGTPVTVTGQAIAVAEGDEVAWFVSAIPVGQVREIFAKSYGAVS